MSNKFKYENSDKHGFKGKKVIIVTRDNIIFLRIVGNYPEYEIITATASEDDKSFLVCNEKAKLFISALQLGLEWNTPFSFEKDKFGRSYILIANLTFNSGKESQDLEELDDFIKRFFEIFDASNYQEKKR